MTFEDFVDYHKNKHATLFSSIPETKQYVRKYVINHPIAAGGFPDPVYDGITEIWFDSFDDFHTFFATENYIKNVHPDESNFINMNEVVVMVTNESIIKAG